MKFIFNLVFCFSVLLFSSCIKDLGNYDYAEVNSVSFKDMTDDSYSVTMGREFSIDAPVGFEKEDTDTSDFRIDWYLDGKKIASGTKLVYTINKTGVFTLVLKVTDLKGGEVYISEPMQLNVAGGFSWGWIILSEEEGRSVLSYISPDLYCIKGIYEDVNGSGLGRDPKSIWYYFVSGSIPGFYVGGKAKIVINQGSGGVTLDASTLEPDMLLSSEFSTGTEPPGIVMKDFANKDFFYSIVDSDGNVYIKPVGFDNKSIPYYGTYSSIPYEFDGGGSIGCSGSFMYMNSNECASCDCQILYDERNCRFIGLYGPAYDDDYFPAVTYFNNYDEDFELPAGVLPVNDMGAGTKVLAIGPYEGMDLVSLPGETAKVIYLWSRYYSVIDVGGTGNYYVHSWLVKSYSGTNHIITDSDQRPFPAPELLNRKSIIKMSANFNIYKYFFFTDGAENLYVCNIETLDYKFIYKAKSDITYIHASPVTSVFKDYGGNPEYPDFRLAVCCVNGNIDILNVRESEIVKIYEGDDSGLFLKKFDGFGTIKGMIWATRGFEGEY